jgi:GNAT superfamily N-acetyltransferase
LVAVHRPTGDFAGMTTIIYRRNHPGLALQDDTVVDPEHRNRGLGRLLKAAMVKEFLAEHPDVERIDTGNAGSNKPMLAINEEMGFRTILEVSAWQGDIATARKALAARA